MPWSMTHRPIALTILILLVVLMFLILFWWRKDAGFLTGKRSECPPEKIVPYYLFHSAKWSAIALSLFSLFFRF